MQLHELFVWWRSVSSTLRISGPTEADQRGEIAPPGLSRAKSTGRTPNLPAMRASVGRRCSLFSLSSLPFPLSRWTGLVTKPCPVPSRASRKLPPVPPPLSCCRADTIVLAMATSDYFIVDAGCVGASTTLDIIDAEPSVAVTLVDRTFPCLQAAAHDINKIIRSDMMVRLLDNPDSRPQRRVSIVSLYIREVPCRNAARAVPSLVLSAPSCYSLLPVRMFRCRCCCSRVLLRVGRLRSSAWRACPLCAVLV